jgi:hypothetical protein
MGQTPFAPQAQSMQSPQIKQTINQQNSTETKKLPILICEKSGLNEIQTGDISQRKARRQVQTRMRNARPYNANV